MLYSFCFHFVSLFPLHLFPFVSILYPSFLFTFIIFFFIPYVPYCPFLRLHHYCDMPSLCRQPLYTTTAVNEFSRVIINTGTSRSRMCIYQTVLHFKKLDIQKHEKLGGGVMFISALLFQVSIRTGGQQKCLT